MVKLGTRLLTLSVVTLSSLALAIVWVGKSAQADESEYYRIVSVVVSKANADSRAENWNPPPDDLALEVSGIAVLDEHRVAVAIRKGDIWLLDGVYEDPPHKLRYHRFATALH